MIGGKNISPKINCSLLLSKVTSYLSLKKMALPYFGASYIASELYTQKDVKAYFNIIGQPPNRTDVRNGLLNFGFAYESGVHTGDPFLSIANKNEIEPILKEIMKHLNEI